MMIDKILVFLFGVLLSGPLLYLGSRDHPITDAGQFFLLRVLASIGAAGIAAMIPGIMDVHWRGTKAFQVRAGGAMAVFVMVYSVNPPLIIQSTNTVLVSSMIANYSNGKYHDAERQADKILETEPKHPEALNVKGGVSYYRDDFERAREYFELAHKYSPSDAVYASNLAYAQIESGAPLQALTTLKSIDDGKVDTHYIKGRANLRAGNYREAQEELEAVPISFHHGAGKILAAASIMGQHPSDQQRERARALVGEAIKEDATFWIGLMNHTKKDRSQTYNLEFRLLSPLIAVYIESSS